MADAVAKTSTPDAAAGNPIDVTTVTTGAGTVDRQIVALGDPSANNKAAVTAAGRLTVDGSGVTQPVSGTVTTTPPANASENVAQFGGTNVVTGAGASAAGVPRVTVSNDSSLAANQSVNVNQVGAVGVVAGTKGTQQTNAVPTQDMKDAGRTYVCLTVDRAAGVSTEALLSLSINKAETVTTATSYTVTAGKTLRLQSLSVSVRASTTTIVDARVRLVTAASAIATGSPRLVALEVFANGAVTEDGNTVTMNFPDGIEIAATHQVAVSNIESTATGTVSVTVVGYEY